MHVSPDLLALLALGEAGGSPEEHAHLAGCSECRAELQSFREAVAVGRRTSEGDTLVSPPPQVWDRIRDELRLGDPLEGPDPVLPDPLGEVEAAPVVRPRPSRLGTRAAALVLAAALALVVGIGIGTTLVRRAQGETVLSTVQLNALPSWVGSSGRVSVERDRQGQRTLVVQVSSPEPASGPREVWMTTTTANPMVAMGYLQGDTGRFPIPPAMDLKVFQLVDVSQEPQNDSDPAHSHNSIVRGKLPA